MFIFSRQRVGWEGGKQEFFLIFPIRLGDSIGSLAFSNVFKGGVSALCVEDCKRADNFDPENTEICSEHFREDCDGSFIVAQALS